MLLSTSPQQLAVDIVRRDEEVRYATLMSLCTLMVIETARKDIEAMRRISDTVQWMNQYWSLTSRQAGARVDETSGEYFLREVFTRAVTNSFLLWEGK